MVQTRSATRKASQSADSTAPLMSSNNGTIPNQNGEQSIMIGKNKLPVLFYYELANGPKWSKVKDASTFATITGPANTDGSKQSNTTIRGFSGIGYKAHARPLCVGQPSDQFRNSYNAWGEECKAKLRSGLAEKSRRNAEKVTTLFPTGKSIVTCLKEYVEDAIQKTSSCHSNLQSHYDSGTKEWTDDFELQFADTREDYLTRNPPASPQVRKDMPKPFDENAYYKSIEDEFGDATVGNYSNIVQPVGESVRHVLIPIEKSSKCSSSD